VAYFLVTGTPPFEGEGVVELCAKHLHEPPVPPSQRRPVPDDLERVILACLAKHPGQRPQSARALARELERCQDAHSWGESEADAWWTDTASSAPRSIQVRATSAELTRRTICCVDLHQRMAERDDNTG
jgi:eukaryotic-like serine/threonine-protein kinase